LQQAGGNGGIVRRIGCAEGGNRWHGNFLKP
jgi:hypothetical protein